MEHVMQPVAALNHDDDWVHSNRAEFDATLTAMKVAATAKDYHWQQSLFSSIVG